MTPRKARALPPDGSLWNIYTEAVVEGIVDTTCASGRIRRPSAAEIAALRRSLIDCGDGARTWRQAQEGVAARRRSFAVLMLIATLQRPYELAFGRPARVSVPMDGGPAGGPFVRFVQAAAAPLGMTIKAESIKARVAAMRRTAKGTTAGSMAARVLAATRAGE